MTTTVRPPQQKILIAATHPTEDFSSLALNCFPTRFNYDADFISVSSSDLALFFFLLDSCRFVPSRPVPFRSFSYHFVSFANSLYFFGIHRRGLSSLPTLLLAFGLALGAAPAAGDFRVGGVGLEFSLAASFLLAVRAISAKVFFFFSSCP